MPDTPERARLERQRSIREIVFGVQDGLLTTLGIVTGVGSATSDRTSVVLTGLISLIVGMISMGAGEYLGGKAEREVVKSAIDFERGEMIEKPVEEYAEQVGFYRLKGFTEEEARMIVDRLATNPDIWLNEMMRDEFGIDPRLAEGSSVGSALAMAGSFAAGGIVPILPYFFSLPLSTSIITALVLAAAALFGIGFFAGRLSGRNPVRKGVEIVVFGAVIFVVSFTVGHFVPPLFGRSSINVGG
ncbi:MAG TPA: VIT1/CCC1 transporter family protein [Candidatus Baltobacteraceae bacterium]